ncbi:MAG: MerC domain-containing protein [Verrucomicrobiota bacterium]|nr:MerC domain-containing protein [Verrucomicrobiota bacterium]
MKITNASTPRCHGWLDHLAIGMAAVCAVHCLLTPILIMAIPIIATSFFVHQDFHLWMIFLVLPTTVFSVFMGCRNHKDRVVLALSAIGLSVLLLALIQERVCYASEGDIAASSADCETCARDLSAEPIPLQAGVWLNAIGCVFLASAHIRNFRLCRTSSCCHDHD